MAEITPNLGLRLSATLTADARYNLELIDLIDTLLSPDIGGNKNLLSAANILIEPESAAITGGSGSGGTVNFGSASHNDVSLSIYGNLTSKLGNSLRVENAAGTYSAGFSAHSSLSANVTWNLPLADGAANQLLYTDGSGNLSWSTALTDSLTQFAVNVGDSTGTRVEIDTSSVGDISADDTAGLLIKAGIIDNTNINASAAVDYSKLATLTIDRVLQSSSSGVVEISTTTATELGYLSGVTSAIQTQLNTGATNLTTHTSDTTNPHSVTQTQVGLSAVDNTSDVTKNAAVVTLTNKSIDSDNNTITNIVDADIKAGAAISATKIADGTVTSTEFQYIGGLTSDAQTQITAKEATLPLSTRGDTLYRNASNVTARLAVGTAAQVLTSDGTDVSWENATGSGAGELSYIANASGAVDVTGWTEETSGQLDISRTDTAAELPREILTETGLKLVGTGSTGTNKYVAYAFTLDDADVGKKLKIEWSQKIISGYTAGDFEVSVYDVTNTTDIVASTTAIHAGTHFLSSFDTTTSLSYELRIRKVAAATNAGIVISNVIVGPGSIVTGAIVGEASTYSIVIGDFSNTTGLTINTGRIIYNRVGERLFMDFFVRFSGTGTDSGGLQWDHHAFASSLGLTFESESVYIPMGTYGTAAGGANGGMAFMQAVKTDFYSNDVTGDVASIRGDDCGASAGVRDIAFQVSLRVADYIGSGTTNLGAGDVEYVSSDGTTISRASSGSAIPTTTPSGVNEEIDTFTWQTPFQSGDSVLVEIDANEDGNWVPFSSASGAEPLRYDGTNHIGLSVNYDGTNWRIVRGKYRAGTSSAWSYFTTGNYRVKKFKGGAVVGFGLATSTSAGLVKLPSGEVKVHTGNGHGSTNTKIRRLTVLEIETGTSITYADTSASGTSFTINEDGIYAMTYVDQDGSSNSQLGISKNGTGTTSIASQSTANRLAYAQSPAAGLPGALSITVRLSSGDVIRPHDDGLLDSTSALHSWFHITQIVKL